MDQCLGTKSNGEPCNGKPTSSGYCMAHASQAPGYEAPERPEPKVGIPSSAKFERHEPAKIPGLKRATAAMLTVGHRAIKMIRPICSICASNTEIAGWGWWNDCPHDPYVGERGEVITKNEYTDELDENGMKTGNRIVAGSKSHTVLRPWPNFVPVALTRRIESGKGPEYKHELNGFIYPEELRSPAFPAGIAPMCEFRECYYQNDLKLYENGTFCQEVEAIVVYEDESGTPVEVANNQIRTDQFALSRSKVRLVS